MAPKIFLTSTLGLLDEASALCDDIARTVDPSAGAGVAAPIGSLLRRTLAGSVELWQKTTAPDTGWELVGGGGGGSAASVGVTWRPGSLATGPLVWDDFDLLYAYVDALRTAALDSGEFLIICDDQDGALELPGSSYDFDRIDLVGVNGLNLMGAALVDLKLDPDTILTKPANASWTITGLRVTGTTGCPAGFGIILDAGQTLNLYNSSLYNPNGSSFAIAEVLTTATIRLDDKGKLLNGGEGQPSVRVNAAATLVVVMEGASTVLESGAISGDVTSALSVTIADSSASCDTTQASFLGSVAFTQEAASWQTTNGNPNGIIAGVLGLSLVDTTNGIGYRCTGGTVWVTQLVMSDPNGFVTAAIGHQIVNVLTGATWINTDGATAWTVVGGGVSSLYVNLKNNNAGTVVLGAPVYSLVSGGVGAFDKARANAANTSEVIGLVVADTLTTAQGDVLPMGPMTLTTGQWDAITGQVGGLTIGALYYLDPATAGKLTTTVPVAVGQTIMPVGRAVDYTVLIINIQPSILL